MINRLTGQPVNRLINKGFTLIELLIVVVLFSAGTVALLQIFSAVIYSGSENQNTLIATGLAQEKVESVRNTAYASITPEARAAVTGYTFFEREVLVDNNMPVASMKQVTINVYWTERPDTVPGSGDVRISLVTYVSDI